MQSAAPHVLATLDRVHSPGRAPAAAREALAAGFEHVNIDLIYGTPGESDDDLRRSVDAAVEGGVDHISAYALTVEEGTAMARRVRRGEISPTDDDVLAHRYELADERLRAAGFDWYEVSNWSRPGGECRHNMGYWDGGEWWGAGPGAHGYVGSTRWWNVKHPNAYAQALADGRLPVADFEELDAGATHTEDVMLRLRLRRGLPTDALSDHERHRAQTAIADGLLTHRSRPAGADRPRPTAGRRRRAHRARLTNRAAPQGRTCTADPQVRAEHEVMTDADQAAVLRVIHDTHSKALLRYVLSLTQGTCRLREDVVQESLLRLWRKPDMLQQPSDGIRAWLFTVARNQVIDDRRSARYARELRTAEIPERRHRMRSARHSTSGSCRTR